MRRLIGQGKNFMLGSHERLSAVKIEGEARV